MQVVHHDRLKPCVEGNPVIEEEDGEFILEDESLVNEGEEETGPQQEDDYIGGMNEEVISPSTSSRGRVRIKPVWQKDYKM